MLAGLLQESDAETVRATLADADRVVTSDLTVVECDRGLIRAQIDFRFGAVEMNRRRTLLEQGLARWTLLRVSQAIIERARQPFPGDPVRTLDALHLATVLAVAEHGDDVTLLSLDRRVRTSARALGVAVLPA